MSPLIRIRTSLNHTKNFIYFVKKMGGKKPPEKVTACDVLSQVFFTDETKSTNTEGISSIVLLSSQWMINRS